MARKPPAATFATVWDIGRTLPGVEQSTTYGSPALRVNGEMFACLAVHRSAEPDSLVVVIGFEERDGLVSEAPDTYYVTPHYVNHPTVLVRLGRIRPEALRDLLLAAHRRAAAKKAPRRRTRRLR